MRKITYFFAVVLTLIFLFSCANGCDKKEHSHLSEWKHDELTHWLVVTCSTSECDFNMPPPAAHVDDDDDGKCDVCGYVIPKHEHTYSNYSDEIGHGWSYTCGCMTPPNFAQHADGDDNGKCDACGYEYEKCNHQWDDGIETEGGLGAYVMEYSCTLCGTKKSETITIIPPENPKVQTVINEGAPQLPQFMSLEVDKHNPLSNNNEISVNCYMGYLILNDYHVTFSDIIVYESDFDSYNFVLEINYNNETKDVAINNLNYFEEYSCSILQGDVCYKKYNTIQLNVDKMTEKRYGFVNVELYMISNTNERYYVSAETLYYSVTDTEIIFGLVSNPVATEGDPGIVTNGWTYQ